MDHSKVTKSQCWDMRAEGALVEGTRIPSRSRGSGGAQDHLPL